MRQELLKVNKLPVAGGLKHGKKLKFYILIIPTIFYLSIL